MSQGSYVSAHVSKNKQIHALEPYILYLLQRQEFKVVTHMDLHPLKACKSK